MWAGKGQFVLSMSEILRFVYTLPSFIIEVVVRIKEKLNGLG